MKKFAQEFKEFALKGNVISLAVGLIIGMAFQEVISSLVENILSPIIGLFVRQNFDTLEFHVLGVTLYYGAFITSVISFIIMALVVFMIVRAMNKVLAEKEAAAAELAEHCPFCKTVLNPDATRCHGCTSSIERQ